jgi:hypothetical protein
MLEDHFMRVSMRAIVSVLVVVAFQGSLHAQPAPPSAPYPTPPGQTAPTPLPPYPTPTAPYPAPVPYPYPPGVVPPYAYVAQLSEEDQALLARGEISDGRYIGGALASVFFGLGIGQAVQGRYHETGWIFTFGEAGSLAAIIVGALQAIDDCDDFGADFECTDDDDGEALMVGGVLGLIAFRAWELVDVFAAPPRHNARVRELRMRLGLPPPMYSRIQPYVAPSMSRDGTAAGLTFRF